MNASRVAAVLLAALLAACVTDPDLGTVTPSPTAASASPSPTPTVDEPFVFAVKGDWGAGTGAQREIAERMCELRKRIAFDVVVTTGDNFYDHGVATRANYTDPEACLIASPEHRWRAAWGNHDQADDTAEVLGAERWYAWRADGVEVFMLDSTRIGDAEQQAWLRDALGASTATVKIAVFHHPAYTVGSVHEPSRAVQRAWVPLFQRHDVRLVLSGHNHVYEHLIVDGIHYVTTGGGGAVLYRCSREHRGLRRCIRAHHFLLVTVDGERIDVRAIDRDGEQIDLFVAEAP